MSLISGNSRIYESQWGLLSNTNDINVNGILPSCTTPLTLHHEYQLPEELSPGERTPSLYLWSCQAAHWGLFVSAAESLLSKSSLNTMSDALALKLCSSAEGDGCKRVSARGPRTRASPKDPVVRGSDKGSWIPAASLCPEHSPNLDNSCSYSKRSLGESRWNFHVTFYMFCL